MNTGFEGDGARISAVQRFLTSAPIRIAVIVLCFLWSLPSIGLLVSSFRTPEEINSTGWWTAFYLYRDNPEYQSLEQRVEHSKIFAERTQSQLEEAQAALEAGVSEEALASAVADQRAELEAAVANARESLIEAQAAVDAGEEGAQERLEEAQAGLEEA